jgi:nicotinamidase/pyrazinamidase
VAEYNPKTALVVVDVQNDFADPKGNLYVRGGEGVVPLINDEIEQARRAGAVVVYSRDWHPQTTPHFQKDGGAWPVHCVADTWGAQFYPGLTVAEGSEIIHKGSGGEDGYSAFSVRDPRSGISSATQLHASLQERSIERIVLVGLATDYCVKETALDALRLGFDVEVLTRGVRAVDLEPGDGERALQAMAGAGSRLT